MMQSVKGSRSNYQKEPAPLENWIAHLYISRKQLQIEQINIPILPGAFLTFASKSSVGPSYAANGQEDHKTYDWGSPGLWHHM